MPYRRRATRGRRRVVIYARHTGNTATRYRRAANRRVGAARSAIGAFRQPVHHFKRWTENIVGLTAAGRILASVGEQDLALTFALSNLQNSGEFVSLYDQYRINKVVLKIFPNFTVNQISPTTGIATPSWLFEPIITVIDHDDNTPTTALNLQEYSTARYHSWWKNNGNGITIKLTPSILAENYESSIATAYTPKFKQWLSTTDPATPHYGIKLAWLGVGGGGGGTIDTSVHMFKVKACYYFSCKNVK